MRKNIKKWGTLLALLAMAFGGLFTSGIFNNVFVVQYNITLNLIAVTKPLKGAKLGNKLDSLLLTNDTVFILPNNENSNLEFKLGINSPKNIEQADFKIENKKATSLILKKNVLSAPLLFKLKIRELRNKNLISENYFTVEFVTKNKSVGMLIISAR